jgi:uncharacterized protein DUF1629
MYYVMQRDTRLAGKYVYFGDEPDGYDGDQWRTGTEMKPPPPTMTLVSQDDRTTKLSDMLLNAADLQVYSPKLVATLTAAGVDNIQYFPITIVHGKKSKSHADYKVANIIGLISCVDIGHSNVSYFRGSKDIQSIEEFKILEDRIVPLKGKKSRPLIFRLGESEFIVLAHESIKKAFEKDGITGARFIPTEQFVG